MTRIKSTGMRYLSKNMDRPDKANDNIMRSIHYRTLFKLTFPYRDLSEYACGLADDTLWKYCVLKRLQAHIFLGSSHVRSLRRLLPHRCHGVSSTYGSSKAFRRIWHGAKPLIFKRFHVVLFGKKHEIWSKQHNGKVSHLLPPGRPSYKRHADPSLRDALLKQLLDVTAPKKSDEF